VLAGITFDQWYRLWRNGELEFDWSRALRFLAITSQSIKNSMVRRVERTRFDASVKKVAIQPPIFILGHWRNGTTLLHNLLAQDTRFAFPNSYQASFPGTFLTMEAFDSKWLSFFMPRHRPMDNMPLRLEDPQEDEFALCSTTLKSPCLAWVFPRQTERFEKYLTFRNVEPQEVFQWRDAFLYFLKKVQWRNGSRRLILKSPPHTARIRLLLELFPEAQFIHVHRNPYAVFQSSLRTFQIMYEWHTVQRPKLEGLEDWVLRQYLHMYDAFFEDKALIPPGRFHELSFEQLERDGIGQIRTLYASLDFPEFVSFEPALREYLDSLAGYRKNTFVQLEPGMRQRIYARWKRCFEAWRYPA
jgi:hypothetical protein